MTGTSQSSGRAGTRRQSRRESTWWRREPPTRRVPLRARGLPGGKAGSLWLVPGLCAGAVGTALTPARHQRGLSLCAPPTLTLAIDCSILDATRLSRDSVTCRRPEHGDEPHAPLSVHRRGPERPRLATHLETRR